MRDLKSPSSSIHSLSEPIVADSLPRPNLDASIRQVSIGLLIILFVIAITCFAIQATRLNDPYIRQVLAANGDSIQGNIIFQINCAGCHAADATGLVGPTLRNVSSHKSDLDLINQVISGQTPPMPRFQPSPEIMADLLSHLKSL
jgi:mono/diheme cytochrome c family protein